MTPTTTAEKPKAHPDIVTPKGVASSKPQAKATRAKAAPKAKPATRRTRASGPNASTAKQAAAPKVKVNKAAVAKPGPARNQEALRLLEGGMTYSEIAAAVGLAHGGVAWNAVARAKKERAKAAKDPKATAKAKAKAAADEA